MGPEDLDALIGEIRQEAARRRAAPDFPLGEEAALSIEMDGTGPARGGADLPAVTAALRRLAAAGGDGRVAELAGLAASAVAALFVRLTELERHQPSPAPPPPAPAGEPAPLLHWLDAVLAAVPTAGRTVVAGAGSTIWVEQLSAAGRDAYGLDPALPPYADEGPVRSGELLDHLRSVADGALAGAVVAGPVAGADAERLPELGTELARVATTGLVVVAEAPWAWRARVGDASADTSRLRPIGPEAWLAALSPAGWTASGRYGPGGRDFLLTADRGR